MAEAERKGHWPLDTHLAEVEKLERYDVLLKSLLGKKSDHRGQRVAA